jgi:hypothetical protein
MIMAGAAEPTASSGLFKAKPIVSVTLRETNSIEVDVDVDVGIDGSQVLKK